MHTDASIAAAITGRRLAVVSVIVSALLAIMNTAAGLVTRSTSVLAAGLEFAGDVAASAIIFFGLAMAAKPPDQDHPYGHGRYETLAGYTVGLILMLAGFAISLHSLSKVDELHPVPPAWAALPLTFALLVKSVLASTKFRTGRRIASAALIADAWNDSVDLLSAFVALIALGLTLYNPAEFLAADHYGGFAVGVVVVLTGLRVVRDASLELVDTMPSESTLERIRTLALEVPGVAGVEKCFARKTGLRYHVDLHVEVDPAISVARGHDIATEVRQHVRESHASVADVLVHIEPHQ